jgi:hypothetical protein
LYGERYPIYWVYYGSIGVADYLRTMNDSFIARLTRELATQSVVVILLLGLYVYLGRPRATEVIAAIALAVAANLVTPAIRKAR